MRLISHYAGLCLHTKHFHSQTLLYRIQREIFGCNTARIFWIAILLEWILFHINLPLLGSIQQTGTGTQTACVTVCITALRHTYNLIAKSWYTKEQPTTVGAYFPTRISATTIFCHRGIQDVIIFTILAARFILPQSTSFFTNPCRPFTSPFPQCQDLLLPPATYVAIFWVLVLLLCAIIMWSESGMPISIPRDQSHPISVGGATRVLLIYTIKGYILLRSIPFVPEDSYPPYSPTTMATFEPVLIPGHWVTAVVTGVTTYTLAAIFYQEIRKHDISPSSWKPFSGTNGAYSDVSIAQVSLPLHSSTIALAVPITGAFNKQSSNVNKRYKYKRPPLTPHTFEPPEAVDTSPPSQVSLNSSYATSTPVKSADYCVPKLDKIEAQFPTREVPCVATFKGSYIDDTSVFFDTGEQVTIDFARMTQFLGKDVDETGSFKVDLSEFARPGSRLGFNDEEVSDLWHDPEFRMEEQQLDAVAPLCIVGVIQLQYGVCLPCLVHSNIFTRNAPAIFTPIVVCSEAFHDTRFTDCIPV
ncbi:hypothetical protein M408DRAFT_85393 [Serendipita vermifera MAFF 305830]|uniref:Uncharacterized protein n=1 Tax=Serendipita vermifera MAFF 305830 TaxID=933852 RepID=A0A0C2XY56_SERVB|nr:hypothetical protein M408DRAFT_85393 [Serendipita vermifera MAFF 305830]